MAERRLIAVEGVVQGVGFRPFVHRLAVRHRLRGVVRNASAGVFIDVQGDAHLVDAFCGALRADAPPLARIERLQIEVAPVRACDGFRIVASDVQAHGAAPTITLPDVAPCDACLSELHDPTNRRYQYPFISCSDCGPRYTIILDTPYDRERTTMAGFALCAECHREYHDAEDRRFHTEAIACGRCGPQLRSFRYPSGSMKAGRDPVHDAVRVLADGQIVAVKALGGYHLACDATSSAAVRRLRARKRREAKPLAVMVRDTNAARQFCAISNAEQSLLESAARPIVILRRLAHTELAGEISQTQLTVGVMLPSSPLHHLLLTTFGGPLVMTSGNRSDEPVAIDDAAAFATLEGIADLLLTHDRPIAVRCDDSIVRVTAGRAQIVRRARGYAPSPVRLPSAATRTVLAVGGHLKNSVCLVVGAQALLSPHVGDLDTLAARDGLVHAVRHLVHAADASPTVIAHDLHPDYASTHLAASLGVEYQASDRIAVQHHHAHVASCLAEHGVTEPVIGVAFDGAGLGADGAIWGGEFLIVEGASYSRCGHLAYVSLPGGDAVARQPWRSAAAHCRAADVAMSMPAAQLSTVEWQAVQRLLSNSSGLPQTSSMGRLFDAIASLLGVAQRSRFEGESAMLLEAIASGDARRRYEIGIVPGAPWTADTGELIRAIQYDVQHKQPVAELAGAFHIAIADLIVNGCQRAREQSGINTVVLTGGVFMNALLLSLAYEALRAARFRVLLHGEIPCNDGGLSLGQAWVAVCAMEDG